METVRQKQMRLDEVRQPGSMDAVNYFCDMTIQYRTANLKVLAVVKPQTDTIAVTPSLTTFGELLEALDVVSGQSQMPLLTS